MEAVQIRPMTAADIRPAGELLRRGQWGDRTPFFAWVVDHPSCHPFVADDAGVVVGTGIATAYGPVGWVGTIFVDERRRRTGLGGALTEAVIHDLDHRGCRTQVLVASDAGRRIYERRGFSFDMAYRRLSAPRGRASPPDDVREFQTRDLDEILALDTEATALDRSAVLRPLADPQTTHVVRRADGTLGGYLLRPPFGGGALIAPDPDDALRLLDYRRWRAGAEGRVIVGLLDANAAGRSMLLDAGWTDESGGTRMIRGAALDWHPDWIWGQLSGALG